MFVFIRLTESYVAPSDAQLALVTGGVRHELVGGFIEKNLFASRNTAFLIENIAQTASFSDIFVYQQTENPEEEIFLETLHFHHSFFMNFFDLATSSDIYLFQGHYARPASVAVAAGYKGDRTLLKFWASYYTRLLPPKHLYVLDGSDAQDAKHVLSKDINIICVPRFSSDQLGFIEAVNTFQRFLLANFQWVMQTSVNEILLHKFGIRQFLNDLQTRTAPAILLPDRVYALTSEAFTASGEKPVANLPHMVPLSASGKPILASAPVTWSADMQSTDTEHADFAQILEQHHIVTEAGLWLIRIVRNQPNGFSEVSSSTLFDEREVKEA